MRCTGTTANSAWASPFFVVGLRTQRLPPLGCPVRRLTILAMALFTHGDEVKSVKALELFPAAGPPPPVWAAAAASLSSPPTLSSSLDCHRFVVVFRPCVKVRAAPSTSAEVLRHKLAGAEVCCSEEQHGWLKLIGEDGWVLRDGSSLGLGVLLQPLEPGASVSTLPPVVVSCTDGLCNRLRVALSFAHVSRRTCRPLIVVWPLLNVCEHRYTDGFEPIPGVTFVDAPPPDAPRPQFPPYAHDFHPEVKAAGDETACFRLLRPNAAVRSRVEANVRALAPHFVSLHIRRTDHWGSTCTDDDFEAFVDQHQPSTAVYLATDNAVTQARFLDSPSRGPRLRACKCIAADPTKLRQTTLEDAAVDLFTCAAASGPFKGTHTSSFSDAILRLRQLGGHAHPHDEHALSDPATQLGVTVLTPGGHREHSAGSAVETYPGASELSIQQLIGEGHPRVGR